MPIVPNVLERLVFLQLNQAPGPMLDLFAAVAFRSVVAALKLGVFERLHGNRLTGAELAQQLGTDERGTLVLLQFLHALGYVRQTQQRYANTAMTNTWLVESSPVSMAPGFRYWSTLLSELWSDLEDTIRTGRPHTNLYAWIEHEPTVSRDFQTWMVAVARLNSGEIVRKLQLPATARRNRRGRASSGDGAGTRSQRQRGDARAELFPAPGWARLSLRCDRGLAHRSGRRRPTPAQPTQIAGYEPDSRSQGPLSAWR